MLCCVCKEKEATVHLTQIEGETMHKVDLCEECAKEKGVNDPTGFSLADLLLGLGVSQEMEKASGNADLKCPNCGSSPGAAEVSPHGDVKCDHCSRWYNVHTA